MLTTTTDVNQQMSAQEKPPSPSPRKSPLQFRHTIQKQNTISECTPSRATGDANGSVSSLQKQNTVAECDRHMPSYETRANATTPSPTSPAPSPRLDKIESEENEQAEGGQPQSSYLRSRDHDPLNAQTHQSQPKLRKQLTFDTATEVDRSQNRGTLAKQNTIDVQCKDSYSKGRRLFCRTPSPRGNISPGVSKGILSRQHTADSRYDNDKGRLLTSDVDRLAPSPHSVSSSSSPRNSRLYLVRQSTIGTPGCGSKYDNLHNECVVDFTSNGYDDEKCPLMTSGTSTFSFSKNSDNNVSQRGCSRYSLPERNDEADSIRKSDNIVIIPMNALEPCLSESQVATLLGQQNRLEPPHSDSQIAVYKVSDPGNSRNLRLRHPKLVELTKSKQNLRGKLSEKFLATLPKSARVRKVTSGGAISPSAIVYEEDICHDRPKVRIFLCVWFVKIEEIDTQKEQFSADAVMKVRWREPALDCVAFDGDIQWGELWDPRLYVVNTLGELQQTKHKFRVYNAKGESFVYEVRRIRGVFLENLELEDFPFDIQDLTITVGSERPDTEIEIIDDPEEPHTVSTQFFVDAQEWYLYRHVHSETEQLENRISATDEKRTWTVRMVKCRAARRPGYFVWNVFVITFLICVLVFISFAVDQTLPQNRLLLNFTLVLTSVAAKSGLSKDLPKISYTTYSDRYMVGGMAFLTMTCLWHGLIGLLPDIPSFDKKSMEIVFLVFLAIGFIAFNVGYLFCVYLFPYARRREMDGLEREYHQMLNNHKKTEDFYAIDGLANMTSVELDMATCTCNHLVIQCDFGMSNKEINRQQQLREIVNLTGKKCRKKAGPEGKQ